MKTATLHREAPAANMRLVSKSASPAYQAVAKYAPFANTQNQATNQLQRRRKTNAKSKGKTAPNSGPNHSVTSGRGSGVKML